MEKVLSISVAAYNLGSMIEQCLDSFIQEDILERVEVLVTDDGSKDNTAEIVAEYEKKYPGTFRLIRQKNAGPGSTVNSGLAHATGKYFRMVDGDDWVNTKEMKAYLDYLESHETDMVCTNYCCVDHETGEQQKQILKVNTWGQEMALKDVAENLHLEMHNVTFRTQILKEHHIQLDHGFYTDAEYLMLPTPYIRTVAFLKEIIYMYRVSLSTQSMNIRSLQRNEKMHRDVIDRLLGEYAEYRKSAGWNPQTGSYYCRRIAAMCGTQLSIYLSFDEVAEYKAVTMEFVKNIREKNEDVYKKIMELKTYKLLVYSHFLLFGIIASMHKKRLGLR